MFVYRYVEFLDTVFLCVKGKPVSWLHYLHHIGAAIDMGWIYQSKFEAGFVFVSLNGLIHSVMYAYYGLSLVGVRMRGKVMITIAQIAQFFVGLAMIYEYKNITECHRGARKLTWLYSYVYVGMVTVFFLHFFFHPKLPRVH